MNEMERGERGEMEKEVEFSLNSTPSQTTTDERPKDLPTPLSDCEFNFNVFGSHCRTTLSSNNKPKTGSSEL